MKLFKRYRKFKDEEILKILEVGGKQEGQVLKYLYKTHFDSVRKLVTSQGGNTEESEDVFQDALIIFYEQVKNGKYVHTAKIKTYLFTVARNNWINKLKRKNKKVEIKHIERIEISKDSSANELLFQKEMIDFAKSILNQLGEDCQKMLDLSLYKKIAMNEIAEIMEFSNAQVARNKKYKCMEQLKKIILKSAELSRLAKELKNE